MNKGDFMRATLRIIVIGSALLVVGCSGAKKPQTKVNRGLLNRKLVKSLFNMQVENAVITQHTLYPYHFVENSAELNTLGEKDFEILSEHFAAHPGKLNIKQGVVSDELYGSRVETIVEKLQDNGVDMEKTVIEDGFAGGTGITSTRAIAAVEKSLSSSSTSNAGASTISGSIMQ